MPRSPTANMSQAPLQLPTCKPPALRPPENRHEPTKISPSGLVRTTSNPPRKGGFFCIHRSNNYDLLAQMSPIFPVMVIDIERPHHVIRAARAMPSRPGNPRRILIEWGNYR